MALTTEQQEEIAERLENVLIDLRHRGVRDLSITSELEDIIDELKPMQ